MLTLEKLGKKLKNIRENLGYSQDFIASELGLNRQAIIGIESGRRKVDSFELFKLSNFYGINVVDLMSESGEIPVKNLQEALTKHCLGKIISEFEKKALSEFDKICDDYEFLKNL